MKNLETLLRLAGVMHFGVLIASAMTPGALEWRKNLAPLHPFLRRLFWVYGAFIMLVVVSFGVLTLLNTGAMAAGDAVARSMCAFILMFWFGRLMVQLFVFDARPFLTNWFYRLGYHALTLVFICFVVIYGWAVVFPQPM